MSGPLLTLPFIFFVIAFIFSMLGMGGSQIYIPLLYWCGLDFKTGNLRGANLRGSNLAGANLRGVELHGANLSGADLTGAILDVAILRVGAV